MIRDHDRIYGGSVTRRLRAMGIRDKPTAPVSRFYASYYKGPNTSIIG
jgi:hypothetical protein